MSELCRVVVKISIESAAQFGKSPAMGAYVCASSSVYFLPSAPVMCTAAAVATTVGKWAADPASKQLIVKAASRGCDVIVKAGQEVTEIVIVKGRAAGSIIEQSVKKADTTYKALNTAAGMQWLMNYLNRSY